MPIDLKKRKLLLGKLSRGLIYTTPLLIATVGYGQLTSDAAIAADSYEFASAQEADDKKKGKSEAKGEAEAKKKGKSEAKGEAEAEAKKKGKSEAKGEAEAEAKKKGKSEAKGEAEAEAKKGKSEAKGEAEAEAEGEAEGDKKLVTRPRRSKRFKGKRADLEARGKELFEDTSLSTNGMSCNSCHEDFLSYNDSFKKSYPHRVAMGKDMFGLRRTTAEQMVQICMVAPMEAKPLPWDSEELAALTAYVKKLGKEYKKM